MSHIYFTLLQSCFLLRNNEIRGILRLLWLVFILRQIPIYVLEQLPHPLLRTACFQILDLLSFKAILESELQFFETMYSDLNFASRNLAVSSIYKIPLWIWWMCTRKKNVYLNISVVPSIFFLSVLWSRWFSPSSSLSFRLPLSIPSFFSFCLFLL